MPNDLPQWVSQGGSFGLLAFMVILAVWFGVPWIVRTQKEHVDQLIAIFNSQQETNRSMVTQITGGMKEIAKEMQEVANTLANVCRRIDVIESHLDIIRDGKRGV